MNPTPEQLDRAAAQWQGTKDGWFEDHSAYFKENWRALPGLRKFVEAEILRGRMPDAVYGETDPKLVRAARAIAANRNARRIKSGLDDVGVLPEDLEDAKAAFVACGDIVINKPHESR
jgi:hypothetical protein